MSLLDNLILHDHAKKLLINIKGKMINMQCFLAGHTIAAFFPPIIYLRLPFGFYLWSFPLVQKNIEDKCPLDWHRTSSKRNSPIAVEDMEEIGTMIG